MDEVARHAPIHKVCSIDEAYCRLIGDERRPDRAHALARRIKAGIAANVGPSLRSSIGLAPTPLLAKIATDLEKPDGLVALRLADLPGRLAHLRLSDLCGIGRRMEERLLRAGVPDVPALWALAPKQARALWGSVAGERFWYALHGYDVPETETARGSIGHGRVLSPDLRAPGPARLVARALVLKAARRMRRHGLAAGSLTLDVWLRETLRFEDGAAFPPTGDSFVLLSHLDAMWARLTAGGGGRPRPSQVAPIQVAPIQLAPIQVSVALHRLVGIAARPPDLFVPRDGGDPALTGGERLWSALDRLDARYGAGTVALASQGALALESLGTKIAFTRIPDRAEFRE